METLPSVWQPVSLNSTSSPQSLSLFEMNHHQMVTYASSMANSLAKIINDQKLYTLIGGKKHVRVEGWCTLGSMLGFLPREVEVKEHQDGSYEAKVELYSLKTGQIVGSASAICSMDEKRWGAADRYARRSMAVTRATGKAYRLGFAWIMSLAGYEGTPAEEMPFEESIRQKPTASSPPIKTTIFDPKNAAHVKAVEAACAQADIPQRYWTEVFEMMIGKSSASLKDVIAQAKELIKEPKNV